MTAVYKRELRSYLTSMVGYLFIFFILLLTGIYFSAYQLGAAYPKFEYTLSALTFVFLISVPILTMRVLAEERKQKTDQLLLTAPVSVGQIVFGKYLALVTIFAIPMLIMCFYPLLMSKFGTVSFAGAYTGILGFFLLGCANLALGVFVSSLTESQVIAAVLTFVFLFAFYMMNGISSFFSEGALSTCITFGLLIFAAALIIYTMIKNLLISAVVCVVGEIILAVVYIVNSSFFSGGIQKVLNIVNLSSHFDNFANSIFDIKGILNGSYSVMISAIFIVIVIVINMIVGSLPSKYTEFDVSSQKLYSIGDETKSYLKKLDKDITIYQVVQSGSEDETLKKLLEKYAEESSHIKVETKDPVVNPKFTSQYTNDEVSANSLIVVCGDRSKVVSYDTIYQSSMDYNTYSYTTTGFDGEGQIDSAISYVTSENLPILYTLDGHGEKELDSTLKEDIEKANIDIQSLNLLTEEKVPEDAACLLINAPTSDISETEKDAVIEYLENGGKAMIFSDYTEEGMTNFDAILANYGVQRTEGVVVEGDSQHYAQMPYYLVPTVNSTDAITDFASKGYYVLMPTAQGIQKTDDVRDTVTIESLLTTSDSAYSKVDVNSGSIEKTDDDIEGPFDLGVSITETLDDDKETQIVYYSSSSLMDSQINQMVSGGNEQMIMESLSWMCSSDETSTISVPAKDLQVSYLTLTAYDTSFWKIVIMGLIPLAFLVIGFGVWLKRRKA